MRNATGGKLTLKLDVASVGDGVNKVGEPVTNIGPDLEGVTPISDMAQPLPPGLEAALKEARDFLGFYNWVSTIMSEHLGVGVEGIVYAFLFEIVPARADVERWIWVIVGDLPPTYLTCEDAKNPHDALDAYIGAMEEWVKAAREGKSVADLIPVNVPATPANADTLERRLKFLDAQILPSLR